MTKYQLYCNFNLANKKADELDEIANSIKILANIIISDNINQIRANWSGDASNEFIKKLNAFSEKCKREADSISDIANTIRRVAKRTYDTEMKALEISRKRAYK